MTENPESFFDEVLSAFDQAFEAATGNHTEQNLEEGSRSSQVAGDGSLQLLFADIAAEYASPLKAFIFHLQRGIATQAWLRFCQPLAAQLQKACGQIELNEVSERLASFATRLQEGLEYPEDFVSGEVRINLLKTYAKLVDVMPRTFQIDQLTEREDLILQLLLDRIKGIGPATRKKLARSNHISFTRLLHATPQDIAHQTSVPLRLAKLAQRAVREHQVRLSAIAPDVFEGILRAELTQLAASLMDRRGRKGSKLRRTALATWNDAQIMLSELGEMKWLAELEALAQSRRSGRLAELLRESEN